MFVPLVLWLSDFSGQVPVVPWFTVLVPRIGGPQKRRIKEEKVIRGSGLSWSRVMRHGSWNGPWTLSSYFFNFGTDVRLTLFVRASSDLTRPTPSPPDRSHDIFLKLPFNLGHYGIDFVNVLTYTITRHLAYSKRRWRSTIKQTKEDRERSWKLWS